VELTFRTLDPRDESPETTRLLKGWLEGLLRGFHDARPKAASWDVWLGCMREDGAVVRGAWLPDGEFGAGPVPVATYSSLVGSLNTGRRPLPLQMITDVTVSPAHRRQGLLRRIITDDLADAADRGLPLAALTVSETTIYGRFGFGLSSWRHCIEVDTTSRFALRDFVDPGRVELADPGELWPVLQRNFAAFHERSRGSVSRPSFYRPWLTGSFDFEEQGPNPRLRAAVHLDASGEPDGHVVYQHKGYDDVGGGKVNVTDLVAADPRAYLALWRFLADIDLCARVDWRNSSSDDPLVWALTDTACRKVAKVDDHIWVRVLDVVTALEGRPWAADGSVVLVVQDPLGHAEGSFRVTVKEGEASVEPVADEPGVKLDAETLGALYLGGVAVETLAVAGRIGGSDDAIGTWAAMADLSGVPFSLTSF
jgi:predicted acetyltransferase